MTTEGAAMRLLELVARAEGKSLDAGKGSAPTRDWILKTYAQCLLTAQQPRAVATLLGPGLARPARRPPRPGIGRPKR
jgi:hypothetical protein